MDNNLIGYILNALDPEARRQVEELLAASPEARARVELLRQALEPLAADRDPGGPPPGLAERTLRFIAEAATRNRPRPPGSDSGGGTRSRWRRADILVAAVLLLSFLSLAIPWVAQLRRLGERHDNPVHLVECKN